MLDPIHVHCQSLRLRLLCFLCVLSIPPGLDQGIVRVFRVASESGLEEVGGAVVPGRQEHECLPVGCEPADPVAELVLREVVLLAIRDLHEIDLPTEVCVAPVVENPVPVGRILSQVEPTLLIVPQLGRAAALDVHLEQPIGGHVRDAIPFGRPGVVAGLLGLVRRELLSRAVFQIVNPQLFL